MRIADKTKTRRFEDGDGDFIELRTVLTIEDSDLVAEAQQALRINQEDGSAELRARIHEARRVLFEIMIVDWSLTDAEGERIEPTTDAYSSLEATSGGWVNDSIDKALEQRKEESGKGKRSSKTRSGSRSTRARSTSKS